MTNEMTTYSMTISRDRDGTKITIADTDNPADADPANPQFAQAMDLGGGRTMHVRTMDANDEGEVVEEVVIVSTDIDAPTAKPFADVYMLNTNPQRCRTARESIFHGRDRQCGHVEFVRVSFYSRYDARVSGRQHCYGGCERSRHRR